MSRDWQRFLEYASRVQARENIEKWGLQDRRTLLLCMQEELGELTQARLQQEQNGETLSRQYDELYDLMALMYAYMIELEKKRYGYEYDPSDIDISDRTVKDTRR